MNDFGQIRFVVPGKPVAKGRPRSRIVQPKGGKAFVAHYTPKKTESEEGAIRFFAQQAMGDLPPLTGPLTIRMTAYVPIPTGWSKKKTADAISGMIVPTGKPDYDNYAKMQDGINGVVWVDDAQIVDAHIYKRYSDKPRLVVVVSRYHPPELKE